MNLSTAAAADVEDPADVTALFIGRRFGGFSAIDKRLLRMLSTHPAADLRVIADLLDQAADVVASTTDQEKQ